MDPLYVQLLVEASVELPFVVFSVLTLVCIVRKFHDGAHGFATEFFLFYITQSFLDLSVYFVRTMHAAIAYNRFAARSSTSFSAHAVLNKYHKAKRILVVAFIVPVLSIIPGLLSRLEFVPSLAPPLLKMTSSTTWSGTNQNASLILISAISVILVVGTFTNNIPLIVLVLKYYPAIYDVYTFSSPVFLFVTSHQMNSIIYQECKTGAIAKVSHKDLCRT
ncbi:hypothetical protein AAVH_20614 [Aphelenchoides avenae]|nr:hypothetical protein AAVH_20614 [Aphelenchus avenae]